MLGAATTVDLDKELAGLTSPAPDWFMQAMAVPREEGFVTVAGCPIHYFRWGARENPGVIMLHGNRAHARIYAFIAPLIAGKFNVTAFDMSGMGDSGPRETYPVELRVQELFAVAEACGMFANGARPFVVAHSFGQHIAVEAAALFPDRLAGAVIVDANMANPEIWAQRVEEMRAANGGRTGFEPRPNRVYPDLPSIMARFRLIPEQPCENTFLLEYGGYHSAKEVAGGWTWKFQPNLFQGWPPPTFQRDQAKVFGALSMPRAYLYGEKSSFLTDELGVIAYIKSQLNHPIPFVSIPEAYHQIMFDQPLGFATALDAILSAWITGGAR